MRAQGGDRRDQVFLGVGFQQVGPRPGSQAAGNGLVVVVHGEQQDLGRGRGPAQLPGDRDAVQSGKRDVQHGDVRVALEGEVEDVGAARSLAAHFPAGMTFHDIAHPAADDLVVIGDKDLDHPSPSFLNHSLESLCDRPPVENQGKHLYLQLINPD